MRRFCGSWRCGHPEAASPPQLSSSAISTRTATNQDLAATQSRMRPRFRRGRSAARRGYRSSRPLHGRRTLTAAALAFVADVHKLERLALQDTPVNDEDLELLSARERGCTSANAANRTPSGWATPI